MTKQKDDQAKYDRQEKRAKSVFDRRLKKAAPNCRRDLESGTQKLLRVISQDKSILVGYSIWKAVLLVYSKNEETVKGINQNNYLKSWGMPMVAVRSKEELPNDAPWAIDTSKKDPQLHDKAVSAFTPGDYMALTSLLDAYFNLIFDMDKGRTFRCSFNYVKNHIVVACSLKRDAAHINRAGLSICGTPIKAEFNKDLTADLADEMESAAEQNAVD